VAHVEVREICLTYPGPQPVEALRDITFDVGENEFVSIIGPSGCGKSTLLRLISDLLPVTSGKVLINGVPAAEARKRREIGFVFQEAALMPWRSSLKNVRLPLEILNRQGEERDRESRNLLVLVGLLDFMEQRPAELSGGMRQRVSIARSLTYDPALLLMDEPFGALDQITRDEMNSELLKIWSQKQTTVIFVTHSIAEAIYLSDRVIVMSPRPGRIVDIIRVPLERPRQPDIKRERAFFDTETAVLRALEGSSVHG
jgi:NitT/TauT family transport system ATP-binding protein